MSQLNELLEIEIEHSSAKIEELKKDRENVAEVISSFSEVISTSKDWRKNVIDDLKSVLIDSYSEILECSDKRIDACQFFHDLFVEASKREDRWREKVGIFSDASQLIRESDNDWNRFKEYLDNLDLKCSYWEEEYRNELLKEISKEIKSNDSDEKEREYWYKEEEIDRIKLKIQNDFLKTLKECKSKLQSELEKSYSEAVKVLEMHFSQLKNLEHSDNNDIFSSISADNYRRFLSCFSTGIDLTICNKEGYNPITYATKYGNNEMIKFFIENDVDFTIKDKNGYNALEVATIHHYKDICGMLIKHDQNLVYESQSLVELAKNDMFINWISQI